MAGSLGQDECREAAKDDALWRAEEEEAIKKRWRDLVSRDLQDIGMEGRWYQQCQDRQQWRRTCGEGVQTIARCRITNSYAANHQTQDRHVAYHCGRSFRRPDDLTRHKRFCTEKV